MHSDAKPDTILTHAGRSPQSNYGVVNPPVLHASTILFPTIEKMRETDLTPLEGTRYGRIGTPTSQAFESAVAALEGAAGAVSFPSGLSAITSTLLAFLQTGDHMLMVDTVYGPTRKFCGSLLRRIGVDVTYYDPMIGTGIDALVQPNTKIIYLESPGSLTFEMQDIPAIAEVARRRGCISIIDNTWATPLFCRPLQLGVDISLHAATKYIVGHSDAMLGVVCCSAETYPQVKARAVELGAAAGPDDLYFGQRGLRSLGARLRQHQAAGLQIADWLAGRPEVTRVIHPALPSHPGHALWKRDYTGASSLFAFELKPVPDAAVNALLNSLTYFGMGYSWGGYESLLIPADHIPRTVSAPVLSGPLLRIHIGLEDTGDLIADLEQGLERLKS
jgi:cysteine-S-conjugate beta-lyase